MDFWCDSSAPGVCAGPKRRRPGWIPGDTRPAGASADRTAAARLPAVGQIYKQLNFITSPVTVVLSCREEQSGAQLLSLDVGGTVYTASHQTFQSVPDSWFCKVISGTVVLPRTPMDQLFVDRDGQVRSIDPPDAPATPKHPALAGANNALNLSAIEVCTPGPQAALALSGPQPGPGVATVGPLGSWLPRLRLDAPAYTLRRANRHLLYFRMVENGCAVALGCARTALAACIALAPTVLAVCPKSAQPAWPEFSQYHVSRVLRDHVSPGSPP